MVKASSMSSENELKLETVEHSLPEDRLKYLNPVHELLQVENLIDFKIYQEEALRFFLRFILLFFPVPLAACVITLDRHGKIVDKWYSLEVMNSSSLPTVWVQPGKCVIKLHEPGIKHQSTTKMPYSPDFPRVLYLFERHNCWIESGEALLQKQEQNSELTPLLKPVLFYN